MFSHILVQKQGEKLDLPIFECLALLQLGLGQPQKLCRIRLTWTPAILLKDFCPRAFKSSLPLGWITMPTTNPSPQSIVFFGRNCDALIGNVSHFHE